MIREIVLAAAALTLVAMDSPASLSAQVRNTGTRRVPPSTVAQFRMQGTQPVAASAGGGELYKYADSSGAEVSVFIYPMRLKHVRTGTQQTLSRAAVAFLSGVADRMRRGAYDVYSIVDNVPISIETPHASVPGRVVTVTVNTNQQPFAEVFYIFAVAPSLVQVRATVPVSARQNTQLRPFVQELLARLAS